MVRDQSTWKVVMSSSLVANVVDVVCIGEVHVYVYGGRCMYVYHAKCTCTYITVVKMFRWCLGRNSNEKGSTRRVCRAPWERAMGTYRVCRGVDSRGLAGSKTKMIRKGVGMSNSSRYFSGLSSDLSSRFYGQV